MSDLSHIGTVLYAGVLSLATAELAFLDAKNGNTTRARLLGAGALVLAFGAGTILKTDFSKPTTGAAVTPQGAVTHLPGEIPQVTETLPTKKSPAAAPAVML